DTDAYWFGHGGLRAVLPATSCRAWESQASAQHKATQLTRSLQSSRWPWVLGMAMGAAEDDGRDRQPATPGQQYQALLKEYNDAFQEYAKAFRAAQTPQDRQKVVREKYPRPDRYASKALELVEKNPKEPFAEEALIWVVTNEYRLWRFHPWYEHQPRYEQ